MIQVATFRAQESPTTGFENLDNRVNSFIKSINDNWDGIVVDVKTQYTYKDNSSWGECLYTVIWDNPSLGRAAQ